MFECVRNAGNEDQKQIINYKGTGKLFLSTTLRHIGGVEL